MRHLAFPSTLLRAAAAASILCLGLAGCGGGGGGGPGLFPLSAPTDLVALAVDLDDDGENIFQLVIADVRGRGSVVLTDFIDPTSEGVDPEVVLWSPDHQRVAFIAVPDGLVNRHVFVVDPQVGVPLDVTGSFPEDFDGDISSSTLRWSPDGTRLAFNISQNTTHEASMVIVAANGSSVVDLRSLSPLGETSHLGAPFWAPNGSRLAFVARLAGGAGDRLFTVGSNAAGFVDTTDSPTPVLGAEIKVPSWSPDSTRLSLQADFEVANRTDVYVARADSSTDHVRVSPVTGAPILGTIEWAPDGSRIAYNAAVEVAGRPELFTVLPDGTSHVKVSGPSVPGSRAFAFFWSPDSTRIAFFSDRLVDDVIELFTVSPTGTSLLPVSVPLVAGGDVIVQQDSSGQRRSPWSPDGSRLAYVADAIVNGTEELFVVAPDGTGTDQLTASGPDVVLSGYTWSPSSRFLAFDALAVVFVADIETPGSIPVAVSGVDRARGVDWSSDSTRYVIEQGLKDGFHLRSTPPVAPDLVELIDPVHDIVRVVTR